MWKKRIILMLILFILVFGSVIIFSNINTKEKNIKEEEEEVLSVQILLYFRQKDSLELGKEYRYVSMEDIKTDLAGTIMRELIKGPASETLTATIPEETKVNSILIENGILILDLSKEFEENHTGSGVAEAITIYSVVNSLTEIKEINAVKFLIDGGEKEKYKENYEFNKPFYRTTE